MLSIFTIDYFDAEVHMEIRNLITFVQTAELNSFTKAAEALDYSQSTVSFQIKQLENELGCLLFERINHTLALTEKGYELLEYAQRIVRLTDEFQQSQKNESRTSGFLHVVTPDSICEAMITERYPDFHRLYPDISLKFSTGDTNTMFRMLDHNEADVVLTLDSHIYRKDYVIKEEARVETHFVTGAASPLAGRKDLRIRDLLGMPFYLTEKGMGYRRVLDEILAEKSLLIEPVLEISRTDIITDLLTGENAVSFLPDFVTEKKVREGKIVRLDVRDINVEIWKQLICHRSKWISRPLQAFITYVSRHEFEKAQP